MADERYAATLIDLLAPLGNLRARRFFGGQGIVAGEVQFAMIIDGVLYLRTDPELAARMQLRGAQPFVYGTRKRDVTVSSYWSVPEELLDEPEVLVEWARRSLVVAQRRKPLGQKSAGGAKKKRDVKI